MRCRSRGTTMTVSQHAIASAQHHSIYNKNMQNKIFWATFAVLGLIAEFALPLWWALFATIPIGYISWWFAYRSDWF